MILAAVYRSGGLAGLELSGGLAGALLGLGLVLSIRRGGRAHPLAVVVAGGLALAALAPILTDLPREVRALLAVALLLVGAELRRGARWGPLALVALVVLWANLQADACLAVLVIWGWLVFANRETARPGGPPAPPLWLIPATAVALLLNPRGPGIIADLPLSLGMRGEYPLLAAWSSIDFHPWSARVAELAGLLLLVGYWLAGRQIRRADGYLGLVTVVLALLWSNYLAWFLVVAAVESGWYLSLPLLLPDLPPGEGAGRGRSGWAAAVAVPIILVLALLAANGAGLVDRGGPGGQTAAQLPVRAVSWLRAHPGAGSWLTTPGFGDYLAARLPSSARLVCVDDPLPLAGVPLQECRELKVLNAGALGTIRRMHVGLGVLPRSAPAAIFLLAQGWTIRYRDPTTVILAPRRL